MAGWSLEDCLVQNSYITNDKMDAYKKKRNVLFVRLVGGNSANEEEISGSLI